MRLKVMSEKISESPNIQTAIAQLSASPSDANRSVLYQALKYGQLFLAARSIPEEWTRGPVRLESATTVSLLTSSGPDGREALLAFTSHEDVQKRSRNSASFSMRSRDVLALILESGFSALVLNPAGPWAYIPRKDIEKILENAS